MVRRTKEHGDGLNGLLVFARQNYEGGELGGWETIGATGRERGHVLGAPTVK